MDNRYHYFAGVLFASASEVDMQMAVMAVPISPYDQSAEPNDIDDIADAWALHSCPYLAGIEQRDSTFPKPINLGIKKEQWVLDELLTWAHSTRSDVRPSARNLTRQ